MYQAIVFLPLLGAIIAALITLAGAHSRHSDAKRAAGAEDHAGEPLNETHAHGAPSLHAAHALRPPGPSRNRISRRRAARASPRS
jgi:NADH-quinone oxidoreductase subunit L